MKSIWKLIAVVAIVGGLAACKKDKGPDGPTDFSNGCEAVDLGLSVKWASYNVGASNAEGYGEYFAWGETKAKGTYEWDKEGDYKWGVIDWEAAPKYGMTKYTGDVEGGDGLNTLQPGDDAATANWGTKWRTPTIEEFKELLDKTKCQWTWDDVRKGYTVMGLATGNSIFLPSAGLRRSEPIYVGKEGYYWSSSLEENSPTEAAYFSFSYKLMMEGKRRAGMSVRAVTEY